MDKIPGNCEILILIHFLKKAPNTQFNWGEQNVDDGDSHGIDKYCFNR